MGDLALGAEVRAPASADAASRMFGKDHRHLQMPGAWVEIVEIMRIQGR